MSKYDDMINRERPVSKKHPPMDIAKRAVQFAPFNALRGLGEVLDEQRKDASGESDPYTAEKDHIPFES